MFYILNKHGHYFAVERTTGLDYRLLADCELYTTERALLEAAGARSGLDMDEVEGGTFIVRRSYTDTSRYVIIDGRGVSAPLDEVHGSISLAQFLSDYEI